MGKLICIEGGLGVFVGDEFKVISENGKEWEILLGDVYRKINKISGRVRGWKVPPRFEFIE